MNLTSTSTRTKIISPTLHLYHYVLRNGMNDRLDALGKRRNRFYKNLEKLSAHPTITLIPLEQDFSPSGNVLDLSSVPSEYKKDGDNRLYFKTGIINSSLAARRLNDTYLLRLIRYISSVEGSQSLDIFQNLGENLSDLDIELGQTVILAGILDFHPNIPEESAIIAANCLNKYYGDSVTANELITDKFLGSPFYIYPQPFTVKSLDEYTIQSIKLGCVFLYQDEATESLADKAYRILQDLLLCYHKINFFYSQSLNLKKLLEKQYQEIETLAEDYAKQKWDNQALKQIPQASLQYYQLLTFLEDQEKSVEVNLRNYQECLQQIEKKTGQSLPQFFLDFAKEARFYGEQIESDIGFLSPALHLYEKLMLSVQTQISIDEAAIQKVQNLRQAQLGQIFAGVGTAIALGQILTAPITTTISQRIEPTQANPSLSSLWLGAGASIIISLILGYLLSVVTYRWLLK